MNRNDRPRNRQRKGFRFRQRRGLRLRGGRTLIRLDGDLSGGIEHFRLLAESQLDGFRARRRRIAIPPVLLFPLLPRRGPDAQEKSGEEV